MFVFNKKKISIGLIFNKVLKKSYTFLYEDKNDLISSQGLDFIISIFFQISSILREFHERCLLLDAIHMNLIFCFLSIFDNLYFSSKILENRIFFQVVF